MRLLLLLFILMITGCASIKPVKESNIEIPENLKEEKNNFEITEVNKPINEEQEIVIIKKVKKIKNNKKQVEEEKVLTQKVRTFNPVFNESLKYEIISPLGMTAGFLEVRVLGEKLMAEKVVIHIKANIYNTAIFASLYKVNLLVESFIDPYDFKSLRYQIRGQEGKKYKENVELYDYKNNQIVEIKKENDIVKTVKHDNSLKLASQDILSSFFKLRYVENFNHEQSFLVASGDKTKKASIKLLEKEKIDNVSYFVMGLSFNPEQPYSDNLIWIDNNRNIFKIKANSKWGKFTIQKIDE